MRIHECWLTYLEVDYHSDIAFNNWKQFVIDTDASSTVIIYAQWKKCWLFYVNL